MKLADIVDKLQLKVRTAQERSQVMDVKGAYVSDLLSDVIANAKEGYLWLTLQTHANILAVAKLKELTAIILVNNRKPDTETLEKAQKERILLIESDMTTFELAGKLYELGIRG